MREEFRRALESNLQGMNQFTRIMDSNFDAEDRKQILDFVFELEMKKTSMNQLDLSTEELDSLLDEIFLPIFGKQTSFVKSLFRNANLIQIKHLAKN